MCVCGCGHFIFIAMRAQTLITIRAMTVIQKLLLIVSKKKSLDKVQDSENETSYGMIITPYP